MARTSTFRCILGALVLSPLLALASCSDTQEDPAVPGVDGGPDTTTTDAPPIDSGTTETGPDAPVTTEGDLERDYCKPSAALVCSRAQACGCGDLVPGGALDLTGCTARLTEECRGAWGPFVTEGATIDKDAAAACIAKLDAATPACGAPSGRVVFASCDPFAIDPAKLGESCKTPYCADGAGRCVEGMCTTAGVVGTDCQNEFRCASGLVCSPVSGKCVAQGTAGTTCQVDEECAPPLACLDGSCKALGAAGATCSNDMECGVGLACTGGSCAAPPATCAGASECGQGQSCGGARTCVARLGVGATCVEDRECEAALFCDDATHTCIARPAKDEPCAKGTVCAPGLGCSIDNGTCVPLPGDGQPCAAGEPHCAGDLGCVEFTCAPLPAEGEPCTIDNRCATGLACDFGKNGSVCIVPKTAGEACASERSCGPGLYCNSADVCAAELPAGAACNSSSECAGACAPDASGGLSCRPAPAAGDPCLTSDDCPDTLRCAAQTTTCIAPVCNAL